MKRVLNPFIAIGLLMATFTIGISQEAKASHTVYSHQHYSSTMSDYRKNKIYQVGCIQYVDTWSVTEDFYDLYDHQYVLFDLYYNEVYTGVYTHKTRSWDYIVGTSSYPIC